MRAPPRLWGNPDSHSSRVSREIPEPPPRPRSRLAKPKWGEAHLGSAAINLFGFWCLVRSTFRSLPLIQTSITRTPNPHTYLQIPCTRPTRPGNIPGARLTYTSGDLAKVFFWSCDGHASIYRLTVGNDAERSSGSAARRAAWNESGLRGCDAVRRGVRHGRPLGRPVPPTGTAPDPADGRATGTPRRPEATAKLIA